MTSITIFALCISLLSVPPARGRQVYSEGLHRGGAFTGSPGKGEVSPAPLGSTLVSRRKPDGLILSTGNLYFTSHNALGASVWRAAQTSMPGQERLLYREAGAVFGDIVFAKVDGQFFGYFFAKRETPSGGEVITIRRVPLTGGAATTLTTVTGVDVEDTHRNLVTDNVSLFWQDDSTVRKMPIRGGPVTVLDKTGLNTPTAGLALRGGNLIYASVSDIRFVPKIGAITPPDLRTIVSTATPVTALFVVSDGVYWGERDGSVRLKVGSTVTTLQPPTSFTPTSISTNGLTAGAFQSWTQCVSGSCVLHFKPSVVGTPMSISADALGVSVTPSRNVFWGDATGVHRRTF
jgi:hypothetical protein